MDILNAIVKIALVLIPIIFAKDNHDKKKAAKKSNETRRWQLIESLAPIAFLAIEALKGHLTGKMSPQESFSAFLGKINALLEGMNQKPIQEDEMSGVKELAAIHSQAAKAKVSNGVR